MDLPSTWIPIIQNRVARAAIGASTARGQRAPGLVAAAREHLAKIDLTKFSESRAEAFGHNYWICERFAPIRPTWQPFRCKMFVALPLTISSTIRPTQGINANKPNTTPSPAP